MQKKQKLHNFWHSLLLNFKFQYILIITSRNFIFSLPQQQKNRMLQFSKRKVISTARKFGGHPTDPRISFGSILLKILPKKAIRQLGPGGPQLE